MIIRKVNHDYLNMVSNIVDELEFISKYSASDSNKNYFTLILEHKDFTSFALHYMAVGSSYQKGRIKYQIEARKKGLIDMGSVEEFFNYF